MAFRKAGCLGNKAAKAFGHVLASEMDDDCNLGDPALMPNSLPIHANFGKSLVLEGQ